MILQTPDNYNRGVRYLARGDYNKAISFFKREVVEFKELYLNLGSCYSSTGRDNKALDNYLKAIDNSVRFANGATGPYPEALNNIGLLHYTYEQDLRAIDYYTAALNANPYYHTARWHRSLSGLRRWVSGYTDVDHRTALIDYDFRFYTSSRPTGIDDTIPRWDGEAGGESIIVLGEQGIGDTFQWMRYVNLLKSRFNKVYVQLPTSLHELHSDYNVVNQVSECDAKVSVPVCSLTRYFELNSASCNYLSRPTGHDFGAGTHVGVVGVGNVSHINNYRRSCGMSWFNDLVGCGSKLYNLTPGARSMKGITPLNPRTWLETAKYISGLDLVITVDTSVAHLAGVLGVPCWVLMPLADSDWRWGDSTCGGANAWYPSVTVFRNPNDWRVVFNNVKECLIDFNSKS